VKVNSNSRCILRLHSNCWAERSTLAASEFARKTGNVARLSGARAILTDAAIRLVRSFVVKRRVITNLVLLAEEGKALMLRNLTPTVAVTLVLTMFPGRADVQQPQEDKNEQGIQAAVRGTLHFESGRGYFIAVKPADKARRAMRVWLSVTEDKETVQKLVGLSGKEVTARGKLEQMPEDVGASVPPLGIYLRRGFEIEAAGGK